MSLGGIFLLSKKCNACPKSKNDRGRVLKTRKSTVGLIVMEPRTSVKCVLCRVLLNMLEPCLLVECVISSKLHDKYFKLKLNGETCIGLYIAPKWYPNASIPNHMETSLLHVTFTVLSVLWLVYILGQLCTAYGNISICGKKCSTL